MNAHELRSSVLIDPAASTRQPELLSSLGRLVRGLSGLFWGLPLALVVCVQTAVGTWLQSMGVAPPMLVTGLLIYGLYQLGHFRKEERVWQNALDRVKLFGWINFGLGPFLFWWHQVPDSPFFRTVVGVMSLSGLSFLLALNPLLCRLTAMLPDETLRHETRVFTNLNRFLLWSSLLIILGYHGLAGLDVLPGPLSPLQVLKDRTGLWGTLFLILMPVAMTMALVWKIKEVILHSVFGGDR